MVPVPLSRRLRRVLATPLAQAAAVPGADRYRKHFTAAAHLRLLVWHALSASPSLRQTHARAAADPTIWAGLGLPSGGVSRSELARSTHSRPLACVATLFTALRDRVAVPRGDPVHIVDSSFIGLSAKLCPWSVHGGHAPGVRVHTGFDLGRAIPTHLRLSKTNVPDITAWREREWAELRGWTVLMDGGYYSHADFRDLRGHGVSWVCPLNAQARVAVTAERYGPWPITDAGDTIVADQAITLGSPNNRNGAVLPNLRLVTSRSREGAEHRTVTDRFDLRADEVVALYRRRWQIELFFRWLKLELGVLHPLGMTEQAVTITLLLAAIVAVLAVLLTEARPDHITDIAWVVSLGEIFRRVLLRGG